MKKRYKRLDLGQRYKIEALYNQGVTQLEIARQVGVNKSTISREFARNVPKKGRYAYQYCAERAQSYAEQREANKCRVYRFTLEQLDYIRDKLRKDRWSPEFISQRGRIEKGDFVSHEYIYQYIWKAKFSRSKEYEQDKDLHQYLRHYKRRRKRRNYKQNRGCIPNRVSIEKRPEVVNKRKRYGDYEVDFMMSKNHRPGLIVLTDRKTLITKLIKTNSKNSKIVAEKIIRKLKDEKAKIHTATFDNDSGFSKHEKIAKVLQIETYFTRPYTSQDKGTVENRIGVIRRFLPKGIDISKVHHSSIKAIERKLNNRPVRKFNYLTPIEKYSSLVALDT